mmetsp:Transcript_1823/g.2743  ORF Transcript_1823/g.2743 Transcript_1823/m.2743 type:complete len:336 (+) Transcript_1823:154-1161(+)
MVGFDSKQYALLQAKAIEERMQLLLGKSDTSSGKHGRIYLEIGGHLLYDGHAARVLPGFDPKCKVKILQGLLHLNPRMVLCVNSNDVAEGRIWNHGETYEQSLLKLLEMYKVVMPTEVATPDICFNLLSMDGGISNTVQALMEKLENLKYRVWKRFVIRNYPNISVGEFGGQNEHIQWDSCLNVRLVIVTALGSSSGKLSTCLGQMYLDRHRLGLASVYAKYELFPIWNLSINHPIQIAYEAATADVGDGDVVEYDAFELVESGSNIHRPVNYNRDNDAFGLLKEMIDKVTSPDEYIRSYYTSPTKMGINTAGFCIIDSVECAQAKYIFMVQEQA